MSRIPPSSFVDAAKALAPQIHQLAGEIEQSRRLPMPLVESMAGAGLFRLWIPRSLGGEETDPMTLARVIEEVSRADGAVGWCLAIGGAYGAFGGYLQPEAAHEIYGSDPDVRTAGAFRPSGIATVVEGGYRVAGRWQLGSGCQHSNWIVGGCRIMEGSNRASEPTVRPTTRILFFPSSDCEIINTWDSIGLRGTGSHDYAVADVFVPARRSLSFREPPAEPGPLYAMPTIALFTPGVASFHSGSLVMPSIFCGGLHKPGPPHVHKVDRYVTTQQCKQVWGKQKPWWVQATPFSTQPLRKRGMKSAAGRCLARRSGPGYGSRQHRRLLQPNKRLN